MESKRFDDDIWLLERITQGSEYDLHLAFWPQENQRILIKSLKPMADELKRKKVESRLLKEAATLEQFWSPYFPKVYDIRRNDEGTLYLILQYFEGVSLRQFLDLNLDHGLNFKVVEKINQEILHALNYLHMKKKIIHFDLSPENIIISPDNGIHLIDFEDAKIIGKKISQKNIRGKQKYMAPELKLSDEQVHASTYFDEFARNTIYREMLALCSSWDRFKDKVLNFSDSKVIPFKPIHHSIFKKTSIVLTATLIVLLAVTFGPFYKENKLLAKKVILTPTPNAVSKPKKVAVMRRPAIPKPKVQVIKRKSSALKKKLKRSTFSQKFQSVLAGHDEELKKCLSPLKKKEVVLSFVLEKRTGKLLKLKTKNEVSQSPQVSACISRIYRDLNYPAHPSQKEVEITQRIVITTKS